jgi:hypothetical protein
LIVKLAAGKANPQYQVMVVQQLTLSPPFSQFLAWSFNS